MHSRGARSEECPGLHPELRLHFRPWLLKRPKSAPKTPRGATAWHGGGSKRGDAGLHIPPGLPPRARAPKPQRPDMRRTCLKDAIFQARMGKDWFLREGWAFLHEGKQFPAFRSHWLWTVSSVATTCAKEQCVRSVSMGADRYPSSLPLRAKEQSVLVKVACFHMQHLEQCLKVLFHRVMTIAARLGLHPVVCCLMHHCPNQREAQTCTHKLNQADWHIELQSGLQQLFPCVIRMGRDYLTRS